MVSNDTGSPGSARTVLIFAGPNGSGKSSITAKFLADPERPFDGMYINADEIAASMAEHIPDARERNLIAANQAEALRLRALAAGDTFAFETVMSTPEKVALMTQAKTRGYEVDLVFVTTSDPSINVRRVADRVATGGHAVQEDAIRARYGAAMRLLPIAVELADTAVVFDNSRTDVSPMLVAQKLERAPLELPPLSERPAWVTRDLVPAYSARVDSLASLAQALKQAGYQTAPPVAYAEAANGRTYAGKIVALTAQHALQEVAPAQFLVHVRALSQERAYRIGEHAKVSYAYVHGKIPGVNREHER